MAYCPTPNRLLRSLPGHELQVVWPRLNRVPLASKRVLVHGGIPCEEVYFIEDGLVSVCAAAGRHSRTEAWLTGREGLVGLPLVLGSATSPHRRIVLQAGTALRMQASDLQNAMRRLPCLSRTLLCYVNAVLVQTSQIAACNLAHEVEHRLARWLLLARDRFSGDTFFLTHDVLSRVLGVRRTTITECMGKLEKQAILATGRGRIRIADPVRLEREACSCYRVIRSEYGRLLHDAHATLPMQSASAAEHENRTESEPVKPAIRNSHALALERAWRAAVIPVGTTHTDD